MVTPHCRAAANSARSREPSARLRRKATSRLVASYTESPCCSASVAVLPKELRGSCWSTVRARAANPSRACRRSAGVTILRRCAASSPLETSRNQRGGTTATVPDSTSSSKASDSEVACPGVYPSKRHRCVKDERRVHRRPSSIRDLNSPSSRPCPDPRRSAMVLRSARSAATAWRTSRGSRPSAGLVRATGLSYLVTTISSPLAMRWRIVPNRIFASSAVTLALMASLWTTD